MNDKTTLQNHLESFKSQMKEVNESLSKFESEFEPNFQLKIGIRADFI